METTLDRRKGRLVNRKVFERGGVRYFLCDCDCGATKVKVRATSFNNGKFTACPECTAKGLAINLYPHHPVRRSVSLEPETMATLGVDVSLEKNQSGRLAGDLLDDLAAAVGEVAAGRLLEPEQWRLLAEAVRKKPDLLESPLAPKGRLYQIAAEAMGELAATAMAAHPTVWSMAVLAALRWRRDHPHEQGDWWKLENRTEGE